MLNGWKQNAFSDCASHCLQPERVSCVRFLNPRWCIVHTIEWPNQVSATKMPILDDIVAGAKDKSKQQLQEALLELLKGNPDILDPVTKSTTRTHSEVVSVFFNRMYSSCRRIICQDECKIISDILFIFREILYIFLHCSTLFIYFSQTIIIFTTTAANLAIWFTQLHLMSPKHFDLCDDMYCCR